MTSVTIPAGPQTAKKPCNCGCQDTPESCCRLDCITRPRFFCGQLLTDQDMTALVDWTDAKLRLARYRHGWGVVCGMRVECDPKSASQVLVTPGYAIGCCGEDIVACAETVVDLSGFCKPPNGNCGLKPPPPIAGKPTHMEIGCLRIPIDELRIVDIYIDYDQKDTDPQTALGRGICQRDVECEYTRTQESCRIIPRAGLSSDDPFQSAADEWMAGYRKCAAVLDAWLSRFARYDRRHPKALDEVRAWLLQWIDANPPREFCFVRECICAMTAAPEEAEIVRWLFWIVQDCRNKYAACNCYSCQTGAGVPLGRVWMRATPTDCMVVRVDPYPPYRRDLAPACWPAPLGYINLARLLWKPLSTACGEAAALGVNTTMTPVEFHLPQTVWALRDALVNCSPMIDCGGEPVLQFVTAGDLGRRVVGFCGRSSPRHGDGVPNPKDRDDLTLLPNIGEGRQAKLNEAGITKYHQIASMDRDRLRQHLPTMAEDPLDEIIERASSLARGGGS
jgi:hypothetical protein